MSRGRALRSVAAWSPKEKRHPYLVTNLACDSHSLGSGYRFKIAFRQAIEYLAANAMRAHPKRDRKHGRRAIGLQPVLTCS